MKQKVIIVVITCLLGVSFNGQSVKLDESLSVQQSVDLEEQQRMTRVCQYWVPRWNSEGYTVEMYTDFKYMRILPEEIINRFERCLHMYANPRYPIDDFSFVIYKKDSPSSTIYKVMGVEYTDGAPPVKFGEADICVWMDAGYESPFTKH